MRISPKQSAKLRRIYEFLPQWVRTAGSVGNALMENRWIIQELKQLPPHSVEKAKFKRAVLQYPLQYILGTQPFGDLDIKCKRNVLIPRWETEEWAIEVGRVLYGEQNLNVVDFCTGSGCIALFIATRLKNSNISALDMSFDALKLCGENFKTVESRISKLGNQFSIVQGDLLKDNEIISTGNENAEIILSNPPYIYESSFNEIEESVRLYEPELALKGKFEFYRAIVNQSIKLNAKGVVIEVGTLEQIKYTHELALKNGFDECIGFNDSAGNPRIVAFWKNNTIGERLRLMGLEQISLS